MLLVFVMKCCIKKPCSLPHNHYCCSFPSPTCLPHLLICTSMPQFFTHCLPTIICVMLMSIVFFLVFNFFHCFLLVVFSVVFFLSFFLCKLHFCSLYLFLWYLLFCSVFGFLHGFQKMNTQLLRRIFNTTVTSETNISSRFFRFLK